MTSTTSNIPSDDRLEIREKVVMDKLPASVSSSFDGAARTQTTTSDIGEYRAEDIKNITHENKIWQLKHSFRPASNYKFPSKLEYGNGRVLVTRASMVVIFRVFRRKFLHNLCLIL